MRIIIWDNIDYYLKCIYKIIYYHSTNPNVYMGVRVCICEYVYMNIYLYMSIYIYIYLIYYLYILFNDRNY